ncbi:serine carboxypeptidase-like 45 [Gossypium australe]|uniref:Serine carboxypeptidase-like 45 n=1 Tax=Gossypium australe TaxID=47621 RepID=A0A5B6WLV4_9ROSI|nr:serine carboxypeptidase-like 45 [Gossypium australe]
MGASTCISKKLNSKASIGFDNITDMLRFLALSTTSSAVNPLLSESWFLSFFNGDGPDTFAGCTAQAKTRYNKFVPLPEHDHQENEENKLFHILRKDILRNFQMP